MTHTSYTLEIRLFSVQLFRCKHVKVWMSSVPVTATKVLIWKIIEIRYRHRKCSVQYGMVFEGKNQ
ncbi:hypothetical protein Hanom_Chr10g00948911 [Helianthus anomalus]